MYNMTELSNVETFSGIVTYANNSTGGLMVGMFLLAFFFIMLMALKKWDFTNALLTSSFIAFIVGAVLSYADILNLLFPLGFLAITAFSAMFVYVTRQ